MNPAYVELIRQSITVAAPILGTLLGILLGAWLGDRYARRRFREELRASERRQIADHQARFFDSLLEPRIRAHQDVFRSLTRLRFAVEATYQPLAGEGAKTELLHALDDLRATVYGNGMWLQLPALEGLEDLSRRFDQHGPATATLNDWRRVFGEAEVRLRATLGLEGLDEHVRDLVFRFRRDAPQQGTQ